MYKLFADCKIINGHLRSIIYDLNRNRFDFITKDLGLYLSNTTYLETDSLGDYFTFLVEKEYIHSLDEDEKELFPSMQSTYYCNSIIEAIVLSVIGWNNFSQLSLSKIIDRFNVKSIVFNAENIENEIELCQLLEEIDNTTLNSIEVIINDRKMLLPLLQYKRIKMIILYEQDKNSIERISKEAPLVVTKIGKYHDRKLFKQHPNYFNVNKELFTESLKHNTYLNKKIFIDNDGSIKNAEETKVYESLETINNLNELENIIQSKEFQNLWNITKEKIDVCKTCEFRNMCVDNRIPLMRNNDEWYNQIECNYNPFICKWDGEEGYLKIIECGVISNEDSYSVDLKKIAEINATLWNIEEIQN